jgi:hypothetical protein
VVEALLAALGEDVLDEADALDEDAGAGVSAEEALEEGVEELPPWSANSHTPASTTTPTTAIWKGREMFAIAASFGISRQEVEYLLSGWTMPA